MDVDEVATWVGTSDMLYACAVWTAGPGAIFGLEDGGTWDGAACACGVLDLLGGWGARDRPMR